MAIGNMMGMQGSGMGEDLFGILDLLRQLYALRSAASGMGTASASGGQQGGGARQLPTMPTGGGPSGLGSGGASNYGDTFDSAGNPLTFAGITSPLTSLPGNRTDLIRALAQSTHPDQYGNIPWNAATPGWATVPRLPNFGAAPLPGNMVDPRNWDPTAWVNHPEWHSVAVDQAQRTYNILHNQGNAGRPYSAQEQRMAANDWRSFGYGSKYDWKQAGRPTTLLGS